MGSILPTSGSIAKRSPQSNMGQPRPSNHWYIQDPYGFHVPAHKDVWAIPGLTRMDMLIQDPYGTQDLSKQGYMGYVLYGSGFPRKPWYLGYRLVYMGQPRYSPYILVCWDHGAHMDTGGCTDGGPTVENMCRPSDHTIADGPIDGSLLSGSLIIFF